jgi:2-C-methyl-D-erythritol 4-phosphate cytidylyltransferase
MTAPAPSSRSARPDVGVVIVAAGKGTRVGSAAAGGPTIRDGTDEGSPPELKQFRWIAGKPMLLHSLQAFMSRPDVCAVVCVLPPNTVGDPPPWIFQCDIERLMLSIGGRVRQESVANGLEDLSDEADIVLVHDAARPLVGQGTIDRVIGAARANGAAIAALPVVDTIKEVGEGGTIVRTVDRSRLWRAQTPQGFRRETIVRAHREAVQRRIVATDDAALCEELGIPVVVVRGTERALKVTEEEDFRRAEALFAIDE